MEAWIKEITPELIPENYREIAQEIGVENLFKLSRYATENRLHIPTPDFLSRPMRNDKIRKDFQHYSVKELCRKYSLSERQVRTIINSN
jgi:Mor family transcriptional regulator